MVGRLYVEKRVKGDVCLLISHRFLLLVCHVLLGNSLQRSHFLVVGISLGRDRRIEFQVLMVDEN